jgi:hypothetical protein
LAKRLNGQNENRHHRQQKVSSHGTSLVVTRYSTAHIGWKCGVLKIAVGAKYDVDNRNVKTDLSLPTPPVVLGTMWCVDDCAAVELGGTGRIRLR